MFQRSYLFLLLFCSVLSTFGQKIRYEVSFSNAIHHEAEISLQVSGIQQKPAIFRMSRSSPGRYATHEFGKNVYNVKAADQQGKPLPLKRIDGDVYEVPSHNGNITLTYTLYANYPDGTYAGIDPESIHLNMPACFMWIKGYDKTPIDIQFNLPAENKGIIATQLIPAKGKSNAFSAPGLQYFMDSPVKIGDLIIREWMVANPDGKEQKIRIALEANATEEQVNDLVEKTKKIVQEAKAVFGELPIYENNTYTFIMSMNAYVEGDGMEHRNSTMISIPAANFNTASLLGVTAHEFFHNWNVERIRPATLEPFNFEKSNMSHELWFAEGFTQYYGELLLARAGLTTPERYTGTMGRLMNTKSNSMGATLYSPIDASNHAVFVDASVSIDKNNYANIFTSYYTYGAALALALDLELQTKFNTSLDDYMRAMWLKFGKTEKAYTVDQMQQTLASISDPAFAGSFFSKYIRGHEAIDYAGLFAKAGFEVNKGSKDKASLGANIRANEQNKLAISSNTLRNSAAYLAGLDIDDEIISIDGQELKSAGEVTNLIGQKKPGDQIMVSYKHRGKTRETKVTLTSVNTLDLTDFKNLQRPITPAMQKIRDSWFTSKVK
jgi:predicted metalloprotease with PDZ domain